MRFLSYSYATPSYPAALTAFRFSEVYFKLLSYDALISFLKNLKPQTKTNDTTASNTKNPMKSTHAIGYEICEK